MVLKFHTQKLPGFQRVTLNFELTSGYIPIDQKHIYNASKVAVFLFFLTPNKN